MFDKPYCEEFSICPEFDLLIGRTDLRERFLKEFDVTFVALSIMWAGTTVTDFLLEPLSAAEKCKFWRERPRYPRKIDIIIAQQKVLEQLGVCKFDHIN